MSSNICSGGRLATALVIASGAASGGTAGPWRGGCIEGQSMAMGVRDVGRHTSTGPLGASVTEIEKKRVGVEIE